MGDKGSTCDQTCGKTNSKCDPDMQSSLTTNELVNAAFLKAGYKCKSFHAPRNYPGAPFSCGRSGDDCAPFHAGGAKSSCTATSYSTISPLYYCKGGDSSAGNINLHQNFMNDSYFHYFFLSVCTIREIIEFHIYRTVIEHFWSLSDSMVGTKLQRGDIFNNG